MSLNIKLYFIICFLVAVSNYSNGQVLLPNQPEQDACNAISLCGNSFFTPFSYRGYGRKLEFCCFSENYERNSVYFKVKVRAAGNIVFTITPVDPAEDYDYTIVDITRLHCPYTVEELSSPANRIRYNGNCNGNCNDGIPIYPGGIVGLNYTSDSLFVPSGTPSDPFLKFIAAKAGDEYLIMVNNFSGSYSGFSINFEGSTVVFEPAPAGFDSVVAVCGSNLFSSLRVTLTEPILCQSLAADGSDFTLGPGAPAIIAASGTNCGGSTGYTNELLLTLSGALPVGGSFTLHTRIGTDNNSIIGMCGESPVFENGYGKDFTVVWPATINAGNDTALCIGGSIALLARLQGTADARIRWQPTTYLSSNSIANPITTPAVDMEYIVTAAPIGFPAACQYKDTIRVRLLKGFDIITPDTIVCRLERLPIELSGDADYTYTWSPASYLSGTTGMLQTAAPETSVVYTVTASYPGCKDSTQSITVAVEIPPEIKVAERATVCFGDTLQMAVSLSSSSDSHTYQWVPAASFSDAHILKPVYTAVNNSPVSLKVTTAHGCVSTMSQVFPVSPLPVVNAGSDMAVETGRTITLQGSVNQPAKNIQWTPAAYLSNGNILNPVATLQDSQGFMLTASNEYGCMGHDSVYITVLNDIHIPNAFSPNGDGVNDTWIIKGLSNYTRASVMIFSRWGNLLFDGKGYAVPWDGMFNGKPLPIGVYYYIIKTGEGEKAPFTGSLTLLR